MKTLIAADILSFPRMRESILDRLARTEWIPAFAGMTVLCAGFLFFGSTLFAQTTQGISSDGRDFYIGYIQPEKLTEKTNNFNSQYTAAYALVSSYTDNVVTVSYFDNAGAESTSL